MTTRTYVVHYLNEYASLKKYNRAWRCNSLETAIASARKKFVGNGQESACIECPDGKTVRVLFETEPYVE